MDRVVVIPLPPMLLPDLRRAVLQLEQIVVYLALNGMNNGKQIVPLIYMDILLLEQGSSPSDIVSDTLQRLSAKAGVLATLAIDRKSSSLLSYKGTLNLLFSSTSTLNVSAAAARTTGTSASVTATSPPPTAAAADSGTGSVTDEEKINDFVQMIWRYVNGTEQMIQGMDEEDDLKLLRLRTKKHELVIVPDSKFIFVVVHDVKSS